jgi:dihydroxy-acid dehydratase
VPATRGAGMHPNREVWVRQPREAKRSGFVPKNKHRPATEKAF